MCSQLTPRIAFISSSSGVLVSGQTWQCSVMCVIVIGSAAIISV